MTSETPRAQRLGDQGLRNQSYTLQDSLSTQPTEAGDLSRHTLTVQALHCDLSAGSILG